MRIAILSDIHANLEALEAVLDDTRRQTVTAYASLGDIIGFNGDPSACLDLAIPLLNIAVRGNHEEALLHRGLFGTPLYTTMMDRTAAMLTSSQLAYIRLLPLRTAWREATLVHSSPCMPEKWSRISSIPNARTAFESFKGRICFFGHTHRASIFKEHNGQISIIPAVYQDDGSCSVILEEGCRYLINPGSVGQPRDSDWRAAYAIYDEESASVTLRRIAYDVDSAASKISRTGLPDSFGTALRKGSSPTGD